MAWKMEPSEGQRSCVPHLHEATNRPQGQWSVCSSESFFSLAPKVRLNSVSSEPVGSAGDDLWPLGIEGIRLHVLGTTCPQTAVTS